MAETSAPSTAPPQQAFAPHWNPAVEEVHAPKPVAPQRQSKSPPATKSFESQFTDSVARVSEELGVDTSAVDQADAAREPVEHDPLGEAEIEVSPGKTVKRSEIAAKLKEYESIVKKQKDFERASQARMREAAEMRKAAESDRGAAAQALHIQQRLQQLANADDATILREFGRDPDKYVQSQIEQQYQNLQKTPEQRRNEEFEAREHALRQRENQWQAQQEAIKAQQEAQANETQVNQHAQQLSADFMKSADALNLPRTGLTIQRYANAYSAALAAGHSPTMDQIGAVVRDMYRSETFSMLEALSDNDGFQTLPKTVQDKIRKSMLAKLGNSPARQEPGQVQPRTRKERPMSTAEYNAYISNLRTKGG